MANRKKDGTKGLKLFSEKLDPEKYNHVATKASLVAVQLISANFEVSPSFFADGDKVKLELCHNVLTLDFYEKEESVAGIFRYEVIAKVGRKHVMNGKSDFMVVYDLPTEPAEYESKAFCARVGLFAAYPYFRALFAHYTSAANMDLPTLPVLSADPLRKQSGKQIASSGNNKSED